MALDAVTALPAFGVMVLPQGQRKSAAILWLRLRINYAFAMLPIFRMIPVGGVFIAMVALVQALTLPGPTRTRLIRAEAPARGPLIDRQEHPEWRQFLILAAIHRAQEVLALRDLPDTPVVQQSDPAAAPMAAHVADAAPQTKVASLPGAPGPADASAPVGVEPSVEELALPKSEQETATAAPAMAPPATAENAAADITGSPAVANTEMAEAPASAKTFTETADSSQPVVVNPTNAPSQSTTSDHTPVARVAESALDNATNVMPGTKKTGEPSSSAAAGAEKKLASISSAITSDSAAPPAATNPNEQSLADVSTGPAQTGNEVTQQSLATDGSEEQAVAEAPKPTRIAELPHGQNGTAPATDDTTITGSVVTAAATALPVVSEELPAVDLPIVLPRPRPNLIKLPRARPAVIPPLRRTVSHHPKPKAAAPNAHRGPPDLFSALFDKRYQHNGSTAAAKPAPTQTSQPASSP
jgi:hypothetical protein